MTKDKFKLKGGTGVIWCAVDWRHCVLVWGKEPTWGRTSKRWLGHDAAWVCKKDFERVFGKFLEEYEYGTLVQVSLFGLKVEGAWVWEE